jgi:hypothetical protein
VVIKMARPSKLTPEVTKRLTEAIRAGNYYEAACGYAGIGYSTFRAWMVRGEKAKSGKYREFVEAITRAEYEAEVRMVALWQKHMPEITEPSETSSNGAIPTAGAAKTWT